MRDRVAVLNTFLSVVLLFFCLVYIPGCATFRTQKMPVIPWKQHYVAVDEIKTWRLKGKISISDGKQRYSALLNWQQDANKYTLTFDAPIGSQYLIISRLGENSYKLVSSDGRVEKSESLEAIMLREVGWSLSLLGFDNWVKGIPAFGKADKLQLNKYKKLEYLEQNMWKIEYDRYAHFKNVYLPTKIKLSYKNVKIKLIVRSWY